MFLITRLEMKGCLIQIGVDSNLEVAQWIVGGALEFPLLVILRPIGPKNPSLIFLLELNYLHEGADLFKEKKVPLTRKKIILCSPGIKYFIVPAALLELSLKFPLQGEQNNRLSLAHDALIQLHLFF